MRKKAQKDYVIYQHDIASNWQSKDLDLDQSASKSTLICTVKS